MSWAIEADKPRDQQATLQNHFASQARIKLNRLLQANGIEVIPLSRVDSLYSSSGAEMLDDQRRAEVIRRLAQDTKASYIVCGELHGYGKSIKAGWAHVITYQLAAPEMMYAFTLMRLYDASAQLLYVSNSVAGVVYQHGLLDPRGFFERLGVPPAEGVLAEQAYAEAVGKPFGTWFGRILVEPPGGTAPPDGETTCKAEWMGGLGPDNLVTFRQTGASIRFTPPVRLAHIFLSTRTRVKMLVGSKTMTDPAEEKFTSLAKKHGYTLVPAESHVNYTIPTAQASSSPTRVKPPKDFRYPSDEERSVTNLLAIARRLNVDGLVLIESYVNYLLAKVVATASGASWEGSIRSQYPDTAHQRGRAKGIPLLGIGSGAGAQPNPYQEVHEQMGQTLFEWINGSTSRTGTNK
jgi:hypothetical protein